jgi:hypothetical protein
MDSKRKILLITIIAMITLPATIAWWIYWRSPPEVAEILIRHSGETNYQFNDKAWLLSVGKNDHNIEYELNSSGLRVAKQVAGVVTERYYWMEGDKLLSLTDPRGRALYHFHYDSSHRVPAEFTHNGRQYRIIYDRTRSPRIIQDKSGRLVKAMSYSESGVLIKDSNPSFSFPLGFAGGLYDSDTGLLHFKQGEYDPANGTWIAKRAPIDIIKNLRQLSLVEKGQVYKCAYNGGRFPHAFICAGYRCGGLQADSREDYFSGNGHVSNNTLYFNQSICQPLQPQGDACDAVVFSHCVEQAIQPRGGEYFDGLSRNCYHAVDEIHNTCSQQACELKEKGKG